jgi:hypothetical protein
MPVLDPELARPVDEPTASRPSHDGAQAFAKAA